MVTPSVSADDRQIGGGKLADVRGVIQTVREIVLLDKNQVQKFT